MKIQLQIRSFFDNQSPDGWLLRFFLLDLLRLSVVESALAQIKFVLQHEDQFGKRIATMKSETRVILVGSLLLGRF